MVGITSYGAYVPFYRLDRAEIARAWSSGSIGGEKAVAGFDEDSITMAVEAAIDCLNGTDRATVEGLYFASTTSPYKEKQAAGVVAMAVDLPQHISTSDFGDSLRCGTAALRAAIDAVQSGSLKNVLLTAADCRMGAPKGDSEQNFGDGAAALFIGDTDVIATIKGSYTHYDNFIDLWRRENDTYIRSWEDRFIITHGYLQNMQEAAAGILKKYRLNQQDFDKVVLYGPDPRNHLAAAKSLGFDPKTQLQPAMFDKIGNTGCAFSLMMLVAALEEAKPGDQILLLSYGDGCDAFILKVTDAIKNMRDRRGIKGHLASKRMMPTYESYLSQRQIIETEPAKRPQDDTFAPLLWRERRQLISLKGHKCRQCETIQYPMRRICAVCRAKDDFDEMRLSDRRGKVFTFNRDNLAASPDPPTMMTVVDFEGGGRIWCMMTDRDPEKVKIDMPVEMTFRKLHDARGIANYFWKSRPLRG
ncbi:MAG: hydroxymethylglutaryl-CoA synthase [Chloroflexota bacterium]|nr:hydroxymethylglutaryl-CoA synthase [Chloroflexota bacterium]